VTAAATQIAPMAPVTEEPSGAAPERRCIVTGDVRPKDVLIRFVVRPAEAGSAGELVPDLEARLPGRGLWITAERDIVARAVAKNFFSRAARGAVAVAPDLADRIEALLARRCIDHLGLARRAGQAVAGFEQVRAWIERGRAGVLVEASDGSPDGRRKAHAGAGDLPVVAVLSGQELGSAFGREWFGHVALAPGRIAQGFCREAARLAGFRGAADAGTRNRLTDR
jgi:predicted RNA-binding protein YlxR (DUF448 family)